MCSLDCAALHSRNDSSSSICALPEANGHQMCKQEVCSGEIIYGAVETGGALNQHLVPYINVRKWNTHKNYDM